MKKLFLPISVLFFSNLVLPIPPQDNDALFDIMAAMTPRGTKIGFGAKKGYVPCPSDCPRKSRFGGIEELFAERS